MHADRNNVTRYERHRRWLLGCSWALALLVGLSVAAAAEGSQQADLADEHELEGEASWYAGKFQGRTTASGEIFDTNELTGVARGLRGTEDQQHADGSQVHYCPVSIREAVAARLP